MGLKSSRTAERRGRVVAVERSEACAINAFCT
jgi:hypothetical protein